MEFIYQQCISGRDLLKKRKIHRDYDARLKRIVENYNDTVDALEYLEVVATVISI